MFKYLPLHPFFIGHPTLQTSIHLGPCMWMRFNFTFLRPPKAQSVFQVLSLSLVNTRHNIVGASV